MNGRSGMISLAAWLLAIMPWESAEKTSTGLGSAWRRWVRSLLATWLSRAKRISSTAVIPAALRAARIAVTRAGTRASQAVLTRRMAPPSGLSLAFLAFRIAEATKCRAESANDGGATRISGADFGLGGGPFASAVNG